MTPDSENPGKPDSPVTIWTASQGRRLRDVRVGRGLRQQELAEAVGQPRSVLSNWETGARRPSLTHLRALAVALNSEVRTLARSAEETTTASGLLGGVACAVGRGSAQR
jgi:DNA-binding XRE family transcriptional regulator